MSVPPDWILACAERRNLLLGHEADVRDLSGIHAVVRQPVYDLKKRSVLALATPSSHLPLELHPS
eukprot:3589226-Amphidinium_carterae.1